MVFRILAIARDCSILLLGVEIFIMLLLPIVVLWHVTHWLRSFIPQMIHAFEDMKAGWFRIASRIHLILAHIRAPFLWIASKSEGLKVFLSRMKST